MALSKHMREFLQTWWDQRDHPQKITSGKATGIVRSNAGLCASVGHFADQFRDTQRSEIWSQLDAELERMFEAEGLSTQYPFDDPIGIEYYRNAMLHQSHLNPKRRDWVLSKLQGP
jgi:hypothetical protein